MPTVPELYATAVRHHQAGRLGEAEALYRHILTVEPKYADAWHLLGVIGRQLGDLKTAAELIRQALSIKPDWAEAYCNLGNVLEADRKPVEAEACYRRAVELKPTLAMAHNNLGNLRKEAGHLGDAAACFREAIRLDPGAPEFHFNLGNTLQAMGDLDAAATSFFRATEHQPAFAQAHNNWGTVLQAQGKWPEAAARFERAAASSPESSEIQFNWGNALHTLGRLDEAAACFERAIRSKPDDARTFNNLGAIWTVRGKPDDASACFHRALQLQPDYAEAHNNLGLVRFFQGEQAEAVDCFRKALQVKPDYAEAFGNLLYVANFCSELSPDTVYADHRKWNEQFARPLSPSGPVEVPDRSPGRRLRVGYVSPDFREHPIGRFILPLLSAHDRTGYEVYCYSSLAVPEEMTERIRSHADVWRPVAGLSHAALADAIRADRIDVLVDLTMHMANSRLPTFARKPAPVQFTYLAYAGTTGLDTIDYRLTDPHLDPKGGDESHYSERSVRLPETYWCYRMPDSLPPVTLLPAGDSGSITFGCFNNFCKVTPPALSAWARILQRVPDSRLLLHALEGTHRNRVRDTFARLGVSPDRVSFVGLQPTAEYFLLYDRIDIALDPFPYGGGTTTCDALVMGVPVVSLSGASAVGRGGRSILTNVGLPDWVATAEDEYVRIAAEKAADRSHLRSLRAGLRDRVRASPLVNTPRFARHVERAYRSAWEAFAAGRPPRSFDVEPLPQT